MRINESTIRRIIREEARRALRENFDLDQIYEYSKDELLSMLDKLKSGRGPEGADLDAGEKALAIDMIKGRLEALEGDDENQQSTLKISKVSWDAIHGPDGGNVLIAFEWKGAQPVSSPELEIYIASAPFGRDQTRKIIALIDTIKDGINNEIADQLGSDDDDDDDYVTPAQVEDAIEAAAKQDLENQSVDTMLSNMETTFDPEYSGY